LILLKNYFVYIKLHTYTMNMFDDNITKHISLYLDSETQLHYLNYYYQQELSKTDYDEELCYNLECLYEWWEQEQRETACLGQE